MVGWPLQWGYREGAASCWAVVVITTRFALMVIIEQGVGVVQGILLKVRLWTLGIEPATFR